MKNQKISIYMFNCAHLCKNIFYFKSWKIKRSDPWCSKASLTNKHVFDIIERKIKLKVDNIQYNLNRIIVTSYFHIF